MTTPNVSIVIPTLNEERYLPYLLDSLVGLENIDVIVVDADSDDKTLSVAASYIDRFSGSSSLRIIPSDVRHIAKQRNLGAGAARHIHLLFLDADVVIPSHATFYKLLNEFSSRKLGVANPRYIAHPLDTHWMSSWAFRPIYTIQKISIWAGKPLFTGACILTHRSVFDSIGGFDEALFASEDADFGRRASFVTSVDVIPVKVATSTRRLHKISGREIYEYAKILPGLVRHGRAPQSIVAHYGFGDHR